MRPILTLLLVINASALFAQPVITSFAPLTAAPGASVTLRGSGFSNTPSEHIVFFGAVRGMVTSSNDSTVIVTVPFGATHALISLTRGNLVAYSSKKFFTTNNTGGTISTSSFPLRQSISSGSVIKSTRVADIDGDGRPDLIAISQPSSSFKIFRNTSNSDSISFTSPANFTAYNRIDYLETGDIDADGKIDIIIGNRGTSTLSIFLNTSSSPGNISFATRYDIAASPSHSFPTIGDFDADGKPDIIYVNGTPKTISVLRNTGSVGNLSFSSSTISLGTFDAGNLTLMDLDGDNKPDLVMGDSNKDSLRVYRNLSTPGSITVSAFIQFPVTNVARRVLFGDLNNDGKVDIIATNYDPAAISILTNTSIGASISFTTASIVNLPWRPTTVAIDDLDGDGKPDLVVDAEPASFPLVFRVAILQNISTGSAITFAPAVERVVPAIPFDAAIVDLDGDSRSDLVISNPNFIYVYRNRTNDVEVHSFTPLSGLAGTTVTIKGFGFAGATAVKFGNAAAASFSILNDSTIAATPARGPSGPITVTGAFRSGVSASSFTILPSPPIILSVSPMSALVGTTVTLKGNYFGTDSSAHHLYFGAVRAAVVSINDSMIVTNVPPGASYQPVSITTIGGTAYSALPFNVTFPGGSGTFSPNTYATRIDSATAGGPAGLAVGDFDRDGKTDVVVVNRHPGSISIHRNTSDSTQISFAPKVVFTTGGGPTSVAVADLDGDGWLDIAVTNYISNTVSTFRNLGSSSTISFAPKVDFASPGYPYLLKIRDINADGKPDIAVICKTGVLSVLQNSSSNSVLHFGARVDSLVDYGAEGLVISDLDGDGKPDIAVSDSSSGRVTIYRNTTIGSNTVFAARQHISPGYGVLAVADMNGDGKPELMAGYDFWNRLNVLVNNSSAGSNVFMPQLHTTALEITPLACADIDGDGKPDLAYAPRYSNSLGILRNSSAGSVTFTSEQLFTTEFHVKDLLFADLDNDGKQELVTANFFSNSFSVFRNQTGEVIKQSLCPGGNSALVSNISDTTHQWQVNTGSGWGNITDNANYSGTQKRTLQLNNIPSSWYGYLYRDGGGNGEGEIHTLKFENRWTGAISNNWSTPGNWSCSSVPDINTEVIINSGNILINTNVVIRSLKINPGATLTVSPGNTLTVTH